MKGSMAQSGCTNVLIGMSSCLNYVTGSSKTPTSSCCSSLANVVQSQPQCLCSALDGSALAGLGISIDKAAALALPGACNVKTPPVSRCNGGGSAAPVMAPARSPQSSDVESSNGPSPTSLSDTGSVKFWVKKVTMELRMTGKVVDGSRQTSRDGLLDSHVPITKPDFQVNGELVSGDWTESPVQSAFWFSCVAAHPRKIGTIFTFLVTEMIASRKNYMKMKGTGRSGMYKIHADESEEVGSD
ncbi:non-specific lipid-transfer protein-like protein [Tanacetum coccineum]